MFVKVKELPECLRAALSGVAYGKDDIKIEIRDKVSLFDAGGAGRRGFSIMVDLATGQTRTIKGSWGGANPFNPTNPVDLDDKEYALPEGGAIIQGSEGQKTFASIVLHPKNVMPCLTAAPDATEEEKSFLAQFRSLKPAYRSKGSPEMVDSLVKRGYLKQSSNGATSITTAGKNACEGVRGY